MRNKRRVIDFRTLDDPDVQPLEPPDLRTLDDPPAPAPEPAAPASRPPEARRGWLERLALWVLTRRSSS
jgi:hypothetical protein